MSAHLTSAVVRPELTGSIAFSATLEDITDAAEDTFADVHPGSALTVSALHLKKHTTFIIGRPGSELVCIVVSGEGVLRELRERTGDGSAPDMAGGGTDVPPGVTVDVTDHDDDEDHQDNVGKVPRVRLEEGQVVVVDGPAEIRTKKHGLRLMLVTPTSHSLLPVLS